MLIIFGLILGLVFCCTLIVFAVIGYGRMSSGMNKSRRQASAVKSPVQENQDEPRP